MAELWVIGGANVDILAASFKELIPSDSNPGRISFSVGGVAHNIACNLAKMGCRVNFITALSTDNFSELVRKDCLDNGLNIEYSQVFSDCSTSLYLAIAQPDGEMNVAIADMSILSRLDVDKIIPILKTMSEEDLVVIDTNLTEKQISMIVSNCKGRIYCDPISTIKADKIKPFLSQLEVLKPNLLEARHLLQTESEDHAFILKGLEKMGLKTSVVSMGEKGLIASNGKEAYHIRNIKVDILSTTGAGDAFMAGYLFGQYHNRGFLESLKYALASSSITVESLSTVSEQMSAGRLEEYYARINKESLIRNIVLE